MPGRLIVCPTPIGNLQDLSPRARQALGEADLVACEDTRRTGLLFERLDIHRPRLVSYHEGNEAERAVQLAQQVERGAKVTLISEAGTPVISDPGYRLIRACLERDLEVEVLPGPSAVITALVASGLPADRWRFEGFLPGGAASSSGSSGPPRLSWRSSRHAACRNRSRHWRRWRPTGRRPSAASSRSSTRRSLEPRWASLPGAFARM